MSTKATTAGPSSLYDTRALYQGPSTREAELPRGQRAVLDLLRRQAHTVLWALSALAAASPEAIRVMEEAAAP